MYDNNYYVLHSCIAKLCASFIVSRIRLWVILCNLCLLWFNIFIFCASLVGLCVLSSWGCCVSGHLCKSLPSGSISMVTGRPHPQVCPFVQSLVHPCLQFRWDTSRTQYYNDSIHSTFKFLHQRSEWAKHFSGWKQDAFWPSALQTMFINMHRHLIITVMVNMKQVKAAACVIGGRQFVEIRHAWHSEDLCSCSVFFNHYIL